MGKEDLERSKAAFQGKVTKLEPEEDGKGLSCSRRASEWYDVAISPEMWTTYYDKKGNPYKNSIQTVCQKSSKQH